MQHRRLGDDGGAEIAVQQIPGIVEELLPDRLVEAHFMAQHLEASGSMPRSPLRTSIGSPGTSLIIRKVMNISAMKVGMVSARRLRKKPEHWHP